jgi:SH3 domain-binding glutamic acid-rich protein
MLSGFGLQGVKVTDDELRELVEEMGLGGDEAEDLVKGLGGVPEQEITAKGKGEGKEKEGSASVKPITPVKKIAEPNEGDSAKEAAPSAAPIPRK